MNNEGQVIPVEYLLVFGIGIIFFGILMLSFNSIVEQESEEAIYIALTDTGNEISSTITQTYLSIPLNGKTNRTIDIPTEVAGETYIIEISDSNPYETDKKALKLTPVHRDTSVYVPLNNVDLLINVSGSASSASGRIKITGDASGIKLLMG